MKQKERMKLKERMKQKERMKRCGICALDMASSPAACSSMAVQSFFAATAKVATTAALALRWNFFGLFVVLLCPLAG